MGYIQNTCNGYVKYLPGNITLEIYNSGNFFDSYNYNL